MTPPMPWTTEAQRLRLHRAEQELQREQERLTRLLTREGKGSRSLWLQHWQTDNARRYRDAVLRELERCAPLRVKLAKFISKLWRTP